MRLRNWYEIRSRLNLEKLKFSAEAQILVDGFHTKFSLLTKFWLWLCCDLWLVNNFQKNHVFQKNLNFFRNCEFFRFLMVFECFLRRTQLDTHCYWTRWCDVCIMWTAVHLTHKRQVCQLSSCSFRNRDAAVLELRDWRFLAHFCDGIHQIVNVKLLDNYQSVYTDAEIKYYNEINTLVDRTFKRVDGLYNLKNR